MQSNDAYAFIQKRMSFAVDQCRARRQEYMGSQRRLLAHCGILDVEAKHSSFFCQPHLLSSLLLFG